MAGLFCLNLQELCCLSFTHQTRGMWGWIWYSVFSPRLWCVPGLLCLGTRNLLQSVPCWSAAFSVTVWALVFKTLFWQAIDGSVEPFCASTVERNHLGSSVLLLPIAPDLVFLYSSSRSCLWAKVPPIPDARKPRQTTEISFQCLAGNLCGTRSWTCSAEAVKLAFLPQK